MNSFSLNRPQMTVTIIIWKILPLALMVLTCGFLIDSLPDSIAESPSVPVVRTDPTPESDSELTSSESCWIFFESWTTSIDTFFFESKNNGLEYYEMVDFSASLQMMLKSGI